MIGQNWVEIVMNIYHIASCTVVIHIASGCCKLLSIK